MNQPGSDLERDIRQALQRKQPSPGFAARVLANLPREKSNPWTRWLRTPALAWATVGVLFVVFGFGSLVYYHHRQELARGRAARQQLMLALRITGAKLQLAQHRVQAIGSNHERTAPPQETEKE